MQPPLQSPTRLAGRIDRLGLYVFSLLCCFAWFYALWGSAVPALVAGFSLSLLVLYTVRLFEKRTLSRRESALRQRIGGEMAVDSLPLQSQASALSNIVAWLSPVLPLCGFQQKAKGMLAHNEDAGRVWVACVQRHAASSAGCDDVLQCVRSARRENADLCIVCATCDFTAEAKLLVEELAPRTRLLSRDGLIRMAGVAAPATDEQLRALGKRRRQKFRRELWQARVLDPLKKRRYLLYGLGLSALYLMSRQVIYIIPALVCLTLFAFCRRKKAMRFTV